MEAGAPLPEWVHRALQLVDSSPDRRITDAALTEHGLQPARVRRYFLDRYGMTFQAYARARRMADAFARLQDGAALDDVVFDSGYDSHSGFREAFAEVFGLPPGAVRESGECIALEFVDTPVGPMAAGATASGVCLLEFADRRTMAAQLRAVRNRFGLPVVPGGAPVLDRLAAELREYFAGTRREFTVPLDIRGTPFQERVWRLLLEIPYGETWSYEELAARLGNPAAVRAVARANALNRICILAPCHRVVNKNGQLGGYGGGLWRKTELLALERGRGAVTEPPSAQSALPFPAPARS